jgi:hypothetical protein
MSGSDHNAYLFCSAPARKIAAVVSGFWTPLDCKEMALSCNLEDIASSCRNRLLPVWNSEITKSSNLGTVDAGLEASRYSCLLRTCGILLRSSGTYGPPAVRHSGTSIGVLLIQPIRTITIHYKLFSEQRVRVLSITTGKGTLQSAIS